MKLSWRYIKQQTDCLFPSCTRSLKNQWNSNVLNMLPIPSYFDRPLIKLLIFFLNLKITIYIEFQHCENFLLQTLLQKGLSSLSKLYILPANRGSGIYYPVLCLFVENWYRLFIWERYLFVCFLFLTQSFYKYHYFTFLSSPALFYFYSNLQFCGMWL